MRKEWSDFIKKISASELDEFVELLSQRKGLYIHHVKKNAFCKLIVAGLIDKGYDVKLSDLTPRIALKYSKLNNENALRKTSIYYDITNANSEVIDFCEFDIDRFLLDLKRKKALHEIFKN